MDMTKMIIDAFMKPLYDGNPEGTLLESIKSYEMRLTEYARNNPGVMDPVGDSGTRDEYNQLYMAVMNGNNNYGLPEEDDKPKPYDYSENQKLPTVHEFLDSYRMVYETSVRPNNRPLTDKAYQELFNVENRTDDLIEAQIIIEKEGLILNTVTADYKTLTEDFLAAADPNYEVTSAVTKATMGVYATATSLEEIVYMGEVAKATCDDIAVQIKLKVEMMQTLMSLIFAWEHSKRKIREGGESIEKFAQSMVLTRRQARKYYRFLAEDMGITWDVIEATPFYRIMLLNPQGLDELWRIKKVMHPSNLDATKYVLFEEILSDKSMEEILLTPQKYPYYEIPDSNMYPAIDTEYEDLAEDLNKDIKYFHRSRNPEGIKTQNELIDGSKTLALSVAGSVEGSNKKPKAISKIDNSVGKYHKEVKEVEEKYVPFFCELSHIYGVYEF
jgi:hypothetical protein